MRERIAEAIEQLGIICTEASQALRQGEGKREELVNALTEMKGFTEQLLEEVRALPDEPASSPIPIDRNEGHRA